MSSRSGSERSVMTEGKARAAYLATANYVNGNIKKRICYQEEAINTRIEMLQDWSNFALEDIEMNKALFVVFRQGDLEKLNQFEKEYVSRHKPAFVRSRFFCDLMFVYEELPTKDYYEEFVRKSIERRRQHLFRDVMLREIIVDAWQGLSTNSLEKTVQLVYLFDVEDMNALVDFELRSFVEVDLIFCEDLKFYCEESESLSDGTRIFGIYKFTEFRNSIQWCRISLDYLNVSIFVDYDTWIVFYRCAKTTLKDLSEGSSQDGVLEPKNVLQLLGRIVDGYEASKSKRMDPGVYSTRSIPSASTESVKKSASSNASSSELVPYLKQRENPLISSNPNVSIEEVVAYCERARISCSSNIPDELLSIWEDEKYLRLCEENTFEASNPENPIDETKKDDVDKVVENAPKSSLSLDALSFNLYQSFDATSFNLMLMKFKKNNESRDLLTERNVYTARRMVKWIAQIIEQQRLIHLTKIVLKMMRRKLSRYELMLFLFFDEIKSLDGSANFLLLKLNQDNYEE